MALAKRSFILPLTCAVGVLPFMGANVWAQTPAAAPPAHPPKWEVEIYGGPMLASRSGDGRALTPPDPERFTAFNGHPSAYVPSWYSGYGAVLLSAVTTAQLAGPGITPLDDALRQPMIDRTHGWHVGGRLMRTLNPRWSLEFAAS